MELQDAINTVIRATTHFHQQTQPRTWIDGLGIEQTYTPSQKVINFNRFWNKEMQNLLRFLISLEKTTNPPSNRDEDQGPPWDENDQPF